MQINLEYLVHVKRLSNSLGLCYFDPCSFQIERVRETKARKKYKATMTLVYLESEQNGENFCCAIGSSGNVR